MATIRELQERRGQLEAKFKQIVDGAEAEDRGLTAEEESTLRQINADDLALKGRIERQRELEALGRELDQPDDPEVDRRLNGRGSTAVDGRGRAASAAELQALAIQGWARHQFGEELTEEQQQACAAVGIRPQSQKLSLQLDRWSDFRQRWRNGMTTPQPGSGGTFVAPSFVSQLETAMLMHGPMLQVAELLDTDTGAELPYPTMNDTSNEGEMVAELEESDEQDIATGAVVFRAHEASSKVVLVSQAMLDDSAFNLVNVISNAFGERLGRLMNRKCTLGTNANEPRGVVTRATKGKETASATAITGDEVLDLIASVDPAYRADPSFALMANDAIWTALRKLKSTDGVYLWQRGGSLGGSLQERMPDTFGGFPIYQNQHMASSMTAGAVSMLAGAFSKYKIRRVRQITMRRMTEKYATQNADGFVAFARFDGDLVDAGTHPVKYLLQKAS